jgi:hypothetical protein
MNPENQLQLARLRTCLRRLRRRIEHLQLRTPRTRPGSRE